MGRRRSWGIRPGCKTSHLEVAGSPVLYTWTVRILTSKHSAVRCCSFIGSRDTGLYNQHEAETVIRTSGRGGIFGLAKHSVPAGGDVVINIGTTWLPLDLWSLDQRSKQR